MIKQILFFLLKVFKNKKKSLKFLKPIIKNTVIEKLYIKFDYFSENQFQSLRSKKKPEDVRNLFFDQGFYHSEKIIQKHLKELSNKELINSVENVHRNGTSFLTPYILEAFDRDNLKKINFFNDSKGSEILNSSINILDRIKSDKQLGEDLLNLLSIDEHHSLLMCIIYIIENKKTSETNNISLSHYFAKSIVFDGLKNKRLNHKFRLAQKFLEEYAKKNPKNLQAQIDYFDSLITQPENIGINRNHSISAFEGEFSPEKATKQFNKLKKFKNFDIHQEEFYKLKLTKSKIDPFIFSGFPRSASVYVYTSLCRGLKIFGTGGVHGGAFPNFTLSQEGLNFMLKSRGTSHTHLSASKTNVLEIFERYKLKKVLIHIRDPRQVLISWLDWIPKATSADHVQFKHYNLPQNYLKLSKKKQLDWLIENWYPKLIKWLLDWINLSENKYKSKIYISKFEDMKKNETLFFENILNFLNIDKDIFIMPTKPTFEGYRNFRNGKVNTWIDELNKSNINKLKQNTPKKIFEYFEKI